MKIAQVSAYIIVGILIIALSVVLLFSVNDSSRENLQNQIEQTASFFPSSITTAIDECIKKSLEEAITTVGVQGGYVTIPSDKKTIDYVGISTAIWYYEGYISFPSDERIAGEIANYLNQNIPTCAAQTLGQEGYDTNVEPATIISFTKESVSAQVSYPMQRGGVNTNTEFADFKVDVNVPLKAYVDQAREIIYVILQDPGYVDLTYLSELNYHTQMFDFPDGNRLFIIDDESSNIKQEPFKLRFGTRIVDLGKNYPPVLELIPDQTVKVGTPFRYTIAATDLEEESIAFSSISYLFDISPSTGEIAFTPREVGTFSSMIQVSDPQGNVDFQEFTIIVTD